MPRAPARAAGAVRVDAAQDVGDAAPQEGQDSFVRGVRGATCGAVGAVPDGCAGRTWGVYVKSS